MGILFCYGTDKMCSGCIHIWDTVPVIGTVSSIYEYYYHKYQYRVPTVHCWKQICIYWSTLVLPTPREVGGGEGVEDWIEFLIYQYAEIYQLIFENQLNGPASSMQILLLVVYYSYRDDSHCLNLSEFRRPPSEY